MIRARLKRPGKGAFATHRRFAIQRFEQAALVATKRAAAEAKAGIRAEIYGARLGALGGAIGSGSDMEKYGRVKRSGASGFSASGWVYVRSRSERTQGAISAYTQGADIAPVKGKWLWIPTDNAPRRIGKYRTTPARYSASSNASSIGPLVFIPGRHGGEALLVVKNVTVRSAGRSNPRRLPKSGRARAGREQRDFVVMFVGIRRTSRAARINPMVEMQYQQSRLRDYFNQATGTI